MWAFCSTRKMRGAVAVELGDDAEDLLDHERREAERGLVHQQEARPRHQRARDREHLLLAAGQRAGELLAALLAGAGSARTCARCRRRSRPCRCADRRRRRDSRARSSAGTRAGSPARARRRARRSARGVGRRAPRRRSGSSRAAGCRMPAIVIISVVLPAPFGPSRQVMPPALDARARRPSALRSCRRR